MVAGDPARLRRRADVGYGCLLSRVVADGCSLRGNEQARSAAPTLGRPGSVRRANAGSARDSGFAVDFGPGRTSRGRPVPGSAAGPVATAGWPGPGARTQGHGRSARRASPSTVKGAPHRCATRSAAAGRESFCRSRGWETSEAARFNIPAIGFTPGCGVAVRQRLDRPPVAAGDGSRAARACACRVRCGVTGPLARRWCRSAVQGLSAAAASPAATSPVASPACLAVARTRPHRFRSRVTAASASRRSSAARAKLFAAGTAGISASAAGVSAGRWLVIRMWSRRAVLTAGGSACGA